MSWANLNHHNATKPHDDDDDDDDDSYLSKPYMNSYSSHFFTIFFGPGPHLAPCLAKALRPRRSGSGAHGARQEDATGGGEENRLPLNPMVNQCLIIIFPIKWL